MRREFGGRLPPGLLARSATTARDGSPIDFCEGYNAGMCPVRRPDLSGNQVRIWTLQTSAPGDAVLQFEPTLAPDEIRLAARFRSIRQRESYVLTRAALRLLLGRCLGTDPRSLRFDYGPNGKAALAPPSRVRFNVAHSGDMAAIAVTEDCEIGIDLEQIRPLAELEQISHRFFCEEEAAEISSLPPGDRERAFFTGWTRKEAYVKALGVGLAKPLNSFRVVEKDDSPRTFWVFDGQSESRDSWTVHDLNFASDYAAAVAYGDRQRTLSLIAVGDIAHWFDPRQCEIRKA